MRLEAIVKEASTPQAASVPPANVDDDVPDSRHD
jgi:hypothetical protein